VTLEGSAESLWSDFSADHDAHVARLASPLPAVVKRVRDHVARLALVFAVDAGRGAISLGDLAAAIEVGSYLEASYRHLLRARQASRGPERAADLETIARHLLGKSPGASHSVRDLQRAWPTSRGPGSKELRAVLDAMDDVARDEIHGGRKPKYQLTGTRHPTRNPAKTKGANVGCRVAPDTEGRA
jgi:hypothetical protein